MRLFRLSAICAVIAASFIGFGAAPASASDLCEEADISGTIVYPWGNPSYTYCQPFPGTFCEGQGAAAYPQLIVYVYVCVPDPVAAP